MTRPPLDDRSKGGFSVTKKLYTDASVYSFQRVEKLDTLLDEGLRIASPHKVRLALCVPRQYHPLS